MFDNPSKRRKGEMFYEPSKKNHGLAFDPFKAIIAPRPIGWISSISLGGEINLAPYSFFNGPACGHRRRSIGLMLSRRRINPSQKAALTQPLNHDLRISCGQPFRLTCLAIEAGRGYFQRMPRVAVDLNGEVMHNAAGEIRSEQGRCVGVPSGR